MSRIPTVTIFVTMLAGCASEAGAPGYDKAAVPDATAAARQAAAICEKEQAPTKFNASTFMACRVTAERNFAMAIHVRKMDVFDSYAGKMLALAADYDAGHIGLKQMDRRAASIRRDFVTACNCGLAGQRGYDYGAFVSSPTSDAGPGMPPSPPSLSRP
jgi:hypothetical protein